MNKEILIELYQRKDRKRKMVLNKLYYSQIHSNLSQNYISSIINRDLGIENLIQADDIRYCKFYFKQKVIATNQNQTQKQKQRPLLLQKSEDIQIHEQKHNLNQQDSKAPGQQSQDQLACAENQEQADYKWPVESEFSYPRVSHQFKFNQK
jgi:hypothetical protein